MTCTQQNGSSTKASLHSLKKVLNKVCNNDGITRINYVCFFVYSTSASIQSLRRTDLVIRSATAHPSPPPLPHTARDSAQQANNLADTSSIEVCSPRRVQSSKDSPPRAACRRTRACVRERNGTDEANKWLETAIIITYTVHSNERIADKRTLQQYH